MPIPRDPDGQSSRPYQNEASATPAFNMRRLSDESKRIEDCDGPVQGTPVEEQGLEKEEGSNEDGLGEALCSDRAELIERIKRGESPTWVPNEAVSGKIIGQGVLSIKKSKLHCTCLLTPSAKRTKRNWNCPWSKVPLPQLCRFVDLEYGRRSLHLATKLHSRSENRSSMPSDWESRR